MRESRNSTWIAAIVVTGGLTAFIGFAIGLLMMRPNREKAKSTIASVQASAKAAIAIAQAKAEKAQVIAQQEIKAAKLETEFLRDELKRIIAELKQAKNDNTLLASQLQESQKKKETQKSKKKKPAVHTLTRPDLDATISFTGTQFAIRNNNDFDWTKVELEINFGIIRGGWTLRADYIKAGTVYTVGAGQFTKSNGERFNPFSHKVKNILIMCDGGGYYSAKWQ